MYSVCQTTHPATTVEHSIQCNFYNLQESNLVVAGANQLSVYRIVKTTTTSSSSSTRTSQTNPELEFIQTFQLYGTVASLQKVTFGSKYSCKRDSLAISFHDAKLSIVEYNPEIHDLKTISMRTKLYVMVALQIIYLHQLLELTRKIDALQCLFMVVTLLLYQSNVMRRKIWRMNYTIHPPVVVVVR